MISFKKAFVQVFKNHWYKLLAIAGAMALLALNLSVPNYQMIFADITLVIPLMIGTAGAIATSSFMLLALNSALAGIVFAMSVFVIRRQVLGGWRTGSAGFMAAVLTPVCPSCALGLLPALGFGGVMAAMPFKGVEFGVISFIVLGASLIYLSKKVNSDSCKIRKK